ncbi:MAG: hypothetical protein A2017_00170 [Lentisphaerae bacterium GWF2_44_16]|nr:MAG: hypothetical protein A2017_00170 [Lentisphaerae bacterium GWF2_44_16]
MPEHTVIIPVYNETQRISLTCDKILEFLEHQDYCFLFVNDGSTDNTLDIIMEKTKGAPADKIKYISLEKNMGKGAAVKKGVEHVETEYLCFMDGDLAYSLEQLITLFDALKNADMVIGNRTLGREDQKNIPPLRRLLGWGFNRLIRVIMRMPYNDTQAGMKGFRTEGAKKIFSKQIINGFSFDVELIFIARKLGYKVGEIPAYVQDDHTEKNSKVNLLKDPIKMFFSLFLIHYYNCKGKY